MWRGGGPLSWQHAFFRDGGGAGLLRTSLHDLLQKSHHELAPSRFGLGKAREKRRAREQKKQEREARKVRKSATGRMSVAPRGAGGAAFRLDGRRSKGILAVTEGHKLETEFLLYQ